MLDKKVLEDFTITVLRDSLKSIGSLNLKKESSC